MATPETLPTAAVLPILSWVRHALNGGAERHALDPALVIAYDIAAKEAGWPTSYELAGPRLTDMMRLNS